MPTFSRRLAVAVALTLTLPLLAVTTSFPAAAVSAADVKAPTPSLEDDTRLVPGVDPAPTPVAPDEAGRMASPINHEIFVSVTQLTPGNAADNLNAVTLSNVQTLVADLNSFWSAQSAGAVSVSLGGYETRATTVSGCTGSTLDALYDAQPAVAFGGQFASFAWVGTNDHLLVLTQEECSGGLGSVGGNGGQMVSGDGAVGGYAKVVGLHEFGHNLGFGHADTTICHNTSTFDGTEAEISLGSTACTTREYRDNIDVMGSSSNIPGGLSSPALINAGYLTDYVVVQGVGFDPITVTLQPLSSGSGLRAVYVLDPNTGEDYYIEYRTNSGWDEGTTAFWGLDYCETYSGYTQCDYDMPIATGGVRVLRLHDNGGVNDTTVMSVGLLPENPSDRTTRQGYLNAGQHFTNHDTYFTVTVNSTSTVSGASITISPRKLSTTTSLMANTYSQVYGTAAPAVLTAWVVHGSGGYPAGTVTFKDGTTVIGSSAVNTTTGKAVLAVPRTLGARVHTLKASFTPTNAGLYGISSSPGISFTVAKATSTATIALARTIVLKNTPTSLTLTVKVPGVTKPTGTVTLYSGNTIIGTGQLLAANAGVMQMTIPGFSTSGIRAISVKYNGDTNITGYRSASKSLTVKM